MGQRGMAEEERGGIKGERGEAEGRERGMDD